MSQVVALFATALFAGAALYVSLAEHPSRFHLPPAMAAIQFRASYARAAVIQALLATIGFLAGMVAMIEGHGLMWGVGGLVVSLPVPFTLVAIMPTNNRLKSETLSDAEITVLLKNWGRLHWVRTVLGLAALMIMIAALVLSLRPSAHP